MSPTPPSPKKKAATLARVRNNQRRCRERKREYVVELEKKIQNLQNAILENAKDHRNSVQWLEAENRVLRELLANTGTRFDESGMPERRDSQDWEDNSDAMAQATLREEASAPGEATLDSMAVMFSASPSISFTAPFLDIPEGELHFSDLGCTRPIIGASPTTEKPDECSNDVPSTPILSSCRPPCTEFAGSSPPRDCGPTNFVTGDSYTTLCSEAYELVRRYNNRGVDMIEIGIRLWNGFRKGDGDQGCKVENKLLFSVLEYISG